MSAFLRSSKCPLRVFAEIVGSALRAGITKGEKEVSKRRADLFFRLKQGEFIAFADGKDKKLRFKSQRIQKEKPQRNPGFSEADIKVNFERVYQEVKTMFTRQD